MSERRTRHRTSDLPWVETTATVVSSEFHQAAWGQAETDGGQDVSYYLTKFTFRVNGVVYDSEEHSRQGRKLGAKFRVRYDPTNPCYHAISGDEESPVGSFWLWILIVLGVLIFLYVIRHFDLLK